MNARRSLAIASTLLFACATEKPATGVQGSRMVPTSTASATAKPRKFRVYKGDVLELEIIDRPGPLVSTSAPPPVPGAPPPPDHPFLSATAFVATDEGELRKVLDESKSLDEFLTKLRARGLRVVDAQ